MPHAAFPSMHPGKLFCRLSNFLYRAATSSSTDAAISTPTTSEFDEGTTIHADPAAAAVVKKENVPTSPSLTKKDPAR